MIYSTTVITYITAVLISVECMNRTTFRDL